MLCVNLDSPKVEFTSQELKECIAAKLKLANFPREPNIRKSFWMNRFIDRRIVQKLLQSLKKKC